MKKKQKELLKKISEAASIIGKKSKEHIEPGYVWAPYIPAYSSGSSYVPWGEDSFEKTYSPTDIEIETYKIEKELGLPIDENHPVQRYLDTIEEKDKYSTRIDLSSYTTVNITHEATDSLASYIEVWKKYNEKK